MKTYANWKGSLTEYLQIGDSVDEEMYDYVLNVMPPAHWSSHTLQLGEPANHINGRATYFTLHRTQDGWTYVGLCYKGTTENIG